MKILALVLVVAAVAAYSENERPKIFASGHLAVGGPYGGFGGSFIKGGTYAPAFAAGGAIGLGGKTTVVEEHGQIVRESGAVFAPGPIGGGPIGGGALLAGGPGFGLGGQTSVIEEHGNIVREQGAIYAPGHVGGFAAAGPIGGGAILAGGHFGGGPILGGGPGLGGQTTVIEEHGNIVREQGAIYAPGHVGGFAAAGPIGGGAILAGGHFGGGPILGGGPGLGGQTTVIEEHGNIVKENAAIFAPGPIGYGGGHIGYGGGHIGYGGGHIGYGGGHIGYGGGHIGYGGGHIGYGGRHIGYGGPIGGGHILAGGPGLGGHTSVIEEHGNIVKESGAVFAPGPIGGGPIGGPIGGPLLGEGPIGGGAVFAGGHGATVIEEHGQIVRESGAIFAPRGPTIIEKLVPVPVKVPVHIPIHVPVIEPVRVIHAPLPRIIVKWVEPAKGGGLLG